MPTVSKIEDDNDFCPLCLEEFDMTDKTFKPCECGYQICVWCWHRIMEKNGSRCPACRRPYVLENLSFTPPDPEEIIRMEREKQRQKRERNPKQQARKHLADQRVIQRNLVYVVGLSVNVAKEEVLRKPEMFGQYGKIVKIVVNKSNLQKETTSNPTRIPTVSAYITYSKREEAQAAINAVDGCWLDDKLLRASFGTTKYCSYFLRGIACTNPDCMYLHDLGEEDDTFNKEDIVLSKALFSTHHHTPPPPPTGVKKLCLPPPSSTPTPAPKIQKHDKITVPASTKPAWKIPTANTTPTEWQTAAAAQTSASSSGARSQSHSEEAYDSENDGYSDEYDDEYYDDEYAGEYDDYVEENSTAPRTESSTTTVKTVQATSKGSALPSTAMWGLKAKVSTPTENAKKDTPTDKTKQTSTANKKTTNQQPAQQKPAESAKSANTTTTTSPTTATTASATSKKKAASTEQATNAAKEKHVTPEPVQKTQKAAEKDKGKEKQSKPDSKEQESQKKNKKQTKEKEKKTDDGKKDKSTKGSTASKSPTPTTNSRNSPSPSELSADSTHSSETTKPTVTASKDAKSGQTDSVTRENELVISTPYDTAHVVEPIGSSELVQNGQKDEPLILEADSAAANTLKDIIWNDLRSAAAAEDELYQTSAQQQQQRHWIGSGLLAQAGQNEPESKLTAPLAAASSPPVVGPRRQQSRFNFAKAEADNVASVSALNPEGDAVFNGFGSRAQNHQQVNEHYGHHLHNHMSHVDMQQMLAHNYLSQNQAMQQYLLEQHHQQQQLLQLQYALAYQQAQQAQQVQKSHYAENLQESLRALLPNVNINFSAGVGALNATNVPTDQSAFTWQQTQFLGHNNMGYSPYGMSSQQLMHHMQYPQHQSYYLSSQIEAEAANSFTSAGDAAWSNPSSTLMSLLTNQQQQQQYQHQQQHQQQQSDQYAEADQNRSQRDSFLDSAIIGAGHSYPTEQQLFLQQQQQQQQQQQFPIFLSSYQGKAGSEECRTDNCSTFTYTRASVSEAGPTAHMDVSSNSKANVPESYTIEDKTTTTTTKQGKASKPTTAASAKRTSKLDTPPIKGKNQSKAAKHRSNSSSNRTKSSQNEVERQQPTDTQKSLLGLTSNDSIDHTLIDSQVQSLEKEVEKAYLQMQALESQLNLAKQRSGYLHSHSLPFVERQSFPVSWN